MFFLFESPLKKNEGFEKKKTTGTDPCSFSFTQFIGQCPYFFFKYLLKYTESLTLTFHQLNQASNLRKHSNETKLKNKNK